MFDRNFNDATRSRRSVGVSVLAMAALMWLAFPGGAIAHEAKTLEEGHAHEATDIWAIARGGQLYDNWMAVLEAEPPQETHPAYPAVGKKKGAATWRCKECHGWDYKGVRGVYGKGSHYTGIRGIRDFVGVDPERIHDVIMNKAHAYTARMIPHSAMEKLALFISLGQIEMDTYIDRVTKMARGDPRRGASFFQTICVVCHGFDGKAMNFRTDENPEFVGTVARENPWEALHKIRFGQPGVGMVSLIALSVQDQVDILAYAQTLPEK